MLRHALVVAATLCLVGGAAEAQNRAPRNFLNPADQANLYPNVPLGLTNLYGNQVNGPVAGVPPLSNRVINTPAAVVGAGVPFGAGGFGANSGYLGGSGVYTGGFFGGGYAVGNPGLYTGSAFGWGGGGAPNGYYGGNTFNPGGFGNGGNGLPTSNGGLVGSNQTRQNAASIVNGVPTSNYRPQRGTTGTAKSKAKSKSKTRKPSRTR